MTEMGSVAEEILASSEQDAARRGRRDPFVPPTPAETQEAQRVQATEPPPPQFETAEWMPSVPSNYGGGAPSPVYQPQGFDLLQRPPNEPATAFGSLAAQLRPGAFERWQSSAEAEQAARNEKAAALEGPIRRYQEHSEQARQEGEQRIGGLMAAKPDLAPPPDLKARPFLHVQPGEPPDQSILKLMQATGLFALGVGGLARGDARGSLVALKGAMQGWMQGDRERAERGLAEWQTKIKGAMQKWETEKESVEMWFKAKGLSGQELFRQIELTALQYDNKILAAHAAKNDDKAFYEALSKADEGYEELALKYLQVRLNAMAAKGLQMPEMVNAYLAAQVQKNRALGQPDKEPDIKQAIDDMRNDGVLKDLMEKINANDLPKNPPEPEMNKVQAGTMGLAKLGLIRSMVGREDVRLKDILGGINPWLNQIKQTGVVFGVIPVPASIAGDLSPAERLLLSEVSGYVDDMLRLKSGAAINEAEYQRMFGFLIAPAAEPKSFLVRLGQAEQNTEATLGVIRQSLRQGNFRVLQPQVPQLRAPALSLHRASPRYKRARAAGLTDEQIEASLNGGVLFGSASETWGQP